MIDPISAMGRFKSPIEVVATIRDSIATNKQTRPEISNI
jgi:hypothetical protein